MRLLFSADWHIKLGQKGVPDSWQINRFNMLVSRLNQIFVKYQCDKHIVGGDIIDRPAPTAEEMELYYACIAKLEHETDIYTGNHEMVNNKHSVLFNMAEETSRCNSLVTVLTAPYRSPDYDIVDYTEIKKDKWKPRESRLCFTHVRGAIPPHVLPEIDLSRLDIYDLVVTGDLHSRTNTQKTEAGTPLEYPGSPLTTSFHRKRTVGANGCLIVDTDTLEVEWVDLGDLPQLIRKTVKVGEDLVADPYDRVIYEVEGDISELKTVKKSDLLDKRINKNVGKPAKLDLNNSKSKLEELDLFLKEVEALPEKTRGRILGKFKELIKSE